MLDGISQSEKMKHLTKEVPAQQGDDRAVGSKSQTGSDKPLSHRSVLTARKRPANFTDGSLQPSKIAKRTLEAEVIPVKYEQLLAEQSPEFKASEKLPLMTTATPDQIASNKTESPFKADDITVNDSEFQQPPGKIKKLTMAIKIFSKSFKTISDYNNPETDRSTRVESIRNRVFTGTTAVLSILTGAIILKGFLHYVDSWRESEIEGCEYTIGFIYAFGSLLTYGAFGIGWLLTEGISRLVTSTVAASVDTREKLAEMITFTSPKERFLKKYQRMEESLTALRIKLIDAELAKKLRDSVHRESDIEAKEHARQETAILNPDIDKEKWHDSLQRYFVREWYEFYWEDIKNLKDDIRKTEDWLNRAAKQKELLANEQRELEELYDDVAPPIVGKLELKPLKLIRV